MTSQYSEDTLKGLMLLSLDGDEAAYRRLLNSARILLAGYYGRRMSAAAADIEDLVQETLMALHAKRATYDRSRPFTAWFFAIARHKLVDHHRAHGPRHAADIELDDSIAAHDEEDAINAQIDVERLLAALPEKQRDLIRQVKLEGQSVADTAVRIGQSESAVKIGVHRGVKALARRLRGEG